MFIKGLIFLVLFFVFCIFGGGLLVLSCFSSFIIFSCNFFCFVFISFTQFCFCFNFFSFENIFSCS